MSTRRVRKSFRTFTLLLKVRNIIVQLNNLNNVVGFTENLLSEHERKLELKKKTELKVIYDKKVSEIDSVFFKDGEVYIESNQGTSILCKKSNYKLNGIYRINHSDLELLLAKAKANKQITKLTNTKIGTIYGTEESLNLLERILGDACSKLQEVDNLKIHLDRQISALEHEKDKTVHELSLYKKAIYDLEHDIIFHNYGFFGLKKLVKKTIEKLKQNEKVYI